MKNLRMSLRRPLRPGVALVLVCVLLGACSAQVASGATAPTSTSGSEEMATLAEMPSLSPEVSASPVPTLGNASTDVPMVVTPRGDKLEATDPETVVLASGGPQLVEFFAFW